MLGPNYFNKVCNNLHLDGQCKYERERVIPAWLKSQLIGKTEEFIKIKHLDSYQEGYDDAINWVLSLEDDTS